MKKSYRSAASQVSLPRKRSQGAEFIAEPGTVRQLIQTILSGSFYIFLMLLTVLILLWYLRQMSDASRFTVHHIEFVMSGKHIDIEKLQKISLPYTGQNFFSADLSALKARLTQLPWVYRVNVSRVWPDRLAVQIKEQVPIARWHGNQLVNHELTIFNVPILSIPKNLPEFKGTAGQLNLIWQNYQSIEKLLLPIRLHATCVELSNRQSWRIKLDNGLTLILGRSNGLDHLKRFVEVYNQVLAAQNVEAIDYIDLRYANGMAVRTY